DRSAAQDSLLSLGGLAPHRSRVRSAAQAPALPEAGGGHRVSGHSTESDLPRRFRLPVGTVAFVTVLYAALYLVWEQSHWGSEALRNLLGNVAFMPLNIAVAVLFGLASRNEVLDPG